MSWCSVSSATAAAVGNGSLLPMSSAFHDHRLSVHFLLSYPCKLKLKINHISYLNTRTRTSVVNRVVDSGLDSTIELNEDTTEPPEEEEVDNESGRLYVGNLPFSITPSQLSDIFAEAGRVLSVEIVYDKRTDRSRGFGFVTMGDADEAKEAIRLFDGSQIGGRSAKVNFPEVPRGGEKELTAPKIRSSQQGFVDSPHKLYAGNLSWSITSQTLRETFKDLPGFLSAKVVYDRESGKSRGFGFITFTSAQDVESALTAMNGVDIEGRPLRLNFAEQRAPVSASL